MPVSLNAMQYLRSIPIPLPTPPPTPPPPSSPPPPAPDMPDMYPGPPLKSEKHPSALLHVGKKTPARPKSACVIRPTIFDTGAEVLTSDASAVPFRRARRITISGPDYWRERVKRQ
ncbi:hypothetical protein B0A55_09833 [Friedmanniomyces simplex]|uniref:Uncharacterized protein n=1 Tax=Friedmanniomyces simplex TaxID=329884 RepID=A0A4U0X1V4_9PEZI|nr:hypothetical protein B0A55_09833 [Friedmanniomyces simplex]